MRPRKRVLLYCANEVMLSVLRFQMDTWGYRVVSSSLLKDMPVLLEGEPFDLVLLIPGEGADAARAFSFVARQLERMQQQRSRPILIYDSTGALPEEVAPTIHRIALQSKSAESLREAMKTAIAATRWKRPQKIPVRAVA